MEKQSDRQTVQQYSVISTNKTSACKDANRTSCVQYVEVNEGILQLLKFLGIPMTSNFYQNADMLT